MSEKEILELVAGLNPAALEAFNSYMTFLYVSLFVNVAAICALLGGIVFGMYKIIVSMKDW